MLKNASERLAIRIETGLATEALSGKAVAVGCKRMELTESWSIQADNGPDQQWAATMWPRIKSLRIAPAEHRQTAQRLN